MRERRGKTDGSRDVDHDLGHLSRLLERSGIILSHEQLEELWTYHQLLREYNPVLNLTRIYNFENMVLKLYVDSILPGKLIRMPSPLLDLGTGPGMPGIPLRIAYPTLRVLLAESRRNRIEFLQSALQRLNLEGLEVVGQGIGPTFEQPVKGVITRAVEKIADTLSRVSGCLEGEGLAVFMKGPRCGDEIEEALSSFGAKYELLENKSYQIPHTPHERRLVVFRRLEQPPSFRRISAMRKHPFSQIESEHNQIFKDMKKLLGARGIKKLKMALVSGSKSVSEILAEFPQQCEAWITEGE